MTIILIGPTYDVTARDAVGNTLQKCDPFPSLGTSRRHPAELLRPLGTILATIQAYTWQYLITKYSHIQDSGSGTCH